MIGKKAGCYNQIDNEGYEDMWKCPRCGREFTRHNQDHYCIKPNTIVEYIESQDEKIRPYLLRIYKIIKSAIPDAEERISWSMPTFWKGRNIIHFAAAKNHMSIYPGDGATAKFAEELKSFDVSKGTIRFSYGQEIPEQLTVQISRWCYEAYKK